MIPTFRRADSLRRTLASCAAQIGLPDGSYEILVIDNDPIGSGRSAVAAFAGTSGVNVRYVMEPSSGISNARNAGLTAVRSRFVAFLDDDEVAAPDWLARLLATQSKFDADVVLAPVYSEVNAAAGHDTSFARSFYTCAVDAKTGSLIGSRILAPLQRKNSAAFPRLASGNVLLDLNSPHLRHARFDSRLGRTGGEDTLFFSELLVSGARLVWCAEAVATEFIGEDRVRPGFVARRAFRGGQIVSWMPLLLRRRRPVLTAYSMVVGAAQVLLYGPASLLFRLAGSPGWLPFMQRAMTGLGKVLWMAPFRAEAYGARVPATAVARVRA